MKACPHCGQTVSEQDRFCVHCGKMLVTVGMNSQTSPNSDPTQDPSSAQNPYSQAQNPYGQAQNPYGQAQNPYGQAQNPYGQGQNPYGQGQNPNNPSGFGSNGYPPPYPPPNAYGPPQERPYNQGQLVFAIINIVLGFFSGVLIALIGLWPLNYVLKARKAWNDAEEARLLALAKRANIITLIIVLAIPLLFIGLIIAIILATAGMMV